MEATAARQIIIQRAINASSRDNRMNVRIRQGGIHEASRSARPAFDSFETIFSAAIQKFPNAQIYVVRLIYNITAFAANEWISNITVGSVINQVSKSS
jgi:hypothetical protein